MMENTYVRKQRSTINVKKINSIIIFSCEFTDLDGHRIMRMEALLVALASS